MKQQVKILGKSYPLAYNLRAIVLFEKLAEKTFLINSVSDWVYLIYACLMAANRDADITFDEFIDGMDEAKLKDCIDWLSKQMAVNNQMAAQGGEAKKKSHSGNPTG